MKTGVVFNHYFHANEVLYREGLIMQLSTS